MSQSESWRQRSYVLLFLGWMSLFLSQRTVPSTISHLQTSAGFSTESLGSLFTCFSLTYALTKLASGFLYDNLHLSPKLLFCSGLAVSGFLCLCFPAAASSSVFLTCSLWLVAGVFQGFGWPACARMLKEWYRPADMGWRYSVLSSGANLAGAVAPILAAYLASTLGWQYIYYILGSICLLMAGILTVNMKTSSGETGSKRAKSDDIGSRESSKAQALPWHSVFLFKEFWLVTILSVVNWTVKASITDWMQLYLTGQMGRSTATAASCVATMEVASITAKLSFGFVSDYLLKKKVAVRQGLCPRAPLLLVLTLLNTLFAHLYAYHITPDASPLWVTVVCFGIGFSTAGLAGMASLSLMESVPPSLSATALGIGDCTTHLLGRSLLGYSVFSYVATHPDWGWAAGYAMVDALALTAVVSALLLVASSSTLVTTIEVPPDKED